MTKSRSTVRGVATGIVGLGPAAGIAVVAYASTDSGVQSKGCAGKWGYLSVYQQGGGNTWAPGDWDTTPLWHSTSTGYRWNYDHATNTGGGQWRVVTNGDFTTATPSCVSHG